MAGATVKVEEQTAMLLQSSVAVKLMVVVPPQMLGGIAPARPLRVGGPQLSIPVKPAIQVLNELVSWAGQVAKLTGAGQFTVGSSESVTETLTMHSFTQVNSSTSSESVKPPPQTGSASTVTDWPVEEPTMVPFPMIVH